MILSCAAKAQFGWNLDTSFMGSRGFPTIYSDTINLNSKPILAKHYIVDTSGLWQIGTSHKTTFGSSLGIMTDTINPYPAKSQAYIEIHEPTDNYASTGYVLLFRHRYDTDSSHAGGTITISADSGKTWQNILSDTNISNSNIRLFGAGSFYFNPALGKKDSCFEGTAPNWMTTILFWAPHNTLLPDSFYIRFNFKSDTSINNTKSGWCIQYIKYAVKIIEDVQDITSLPIRTYPNPCTDAEYIDLRKLPIGSVAQLKVNDMLGRTIYTLDKPQGYMTIDTHTWAQGMYIVKLITSDGKTYTHKLTKQ